MTVHPGLTVARGRRRFYVGMALALAITVFAGFAPTNYLRAYYQSAPLGGLRHLHGGPMRLAQHLEPDAPG